MGKTLPIDCCYYRVYTDEDTPCEEQHFRYVERRLPIPVEQAALVLVDVWSTHYIDTWLQRAKEVTSTRIVPALEAARKAGMTVVHAPSPYITERRYGAPRQTAAPPTGPAPDWPPAAFRGIYRGGEYAAFGRDQEPRLPGVYARYEKEMDIAEPARPLPGELVITTADEMHAHLAERQILHLFYVGFATNWCLIGRDYGMVAMNQRGYNLILLSDATAGIEFHDTVETIAATRMQVREIETKYAWSTTTEAFVAACGRAQ